MPWDIPCIGDRMNSNLASSLTLFYRLLLNMYPHAYRAQFGKEMYETFLEGIEEAKTQGRLRRFIWRELRDTPKALAHVYWDGWRMKLQDGIHVFEDIASTAACKAVPVIPFVIHTETGVLVIVKWACPNSPIACVF